MMSKPRSCQSRTARRRTHHEARGRDVRAPAGTVRTHLRAADEGARIVERYHRASRGLLEPEAADLGVGQAFGVGVGLAFVDDLPQDRRERLEVAWLCVADPHTPDGKAGGRRRADRNDVRFGPFG